MLLIARGLALVSVLALTPAIGVYVYHLGFFNQPVLEIKTYPPLHLVFKQHKGSYSELPRAEEEIRQWANSVNLQCADTFDELLSDWQKTPAPDLLANVGCVVQEVGSLALTEYQYKVLPAKEFLVGTFLGSSSLSGRPLYWAARDYQIKKRKSINGPVIRIHHQANPLWGQPVEEVLYPLIDVDPTSSNP